MTQRVGHIARPPSAVIVKLIFIGILNEALFQIYKKGYSINHFDRSFGALLFVFASQFDVSRTNVISGYKLLTAFNQLEISHVPDALNFLTPILCDLALLTKMLLVV